MDKLKEARLSYYKTILAIDNEVDLDKLLPATSSDNYQEILQGYIDVLTLEIKEYKELVDKEENTEMKAMFSEELKQLKLKLIFCNLKLDNYLKGNVEPVDKIDPLNKRNIIFGLSPVGNVAAFNDIKKNIDSHYYPTILELLEQLENGVLTNNQEVMKKFSSSNNKLQGLMEIKGFQIRIIYRLLPENMIYIDMVRVKKDDRVSKDLEEPIIRAKLLAKDYELVKKRVKLKDRVGELIMDGQQTMNEIKEYLRKSLKQGRGVANGE